MKAFSLYSGLAEDECGVGSESEDMLLCRDRSEALL